jgi:hypothetical protein
MRAWAQEPCLKHGAECGRKLGVLVRVPQAVGQVLQRRRRIRKVGNDLKELADAQRAQRLA